MDATWRSSVSMSDRMTATMKIMSACKTAFRDSSSTELQSRARETESRAFEEASSREDYQRLWKEQLEILLNQVQSTEPVPTTSDVYPEDLTVPVEQIGPYKATHHSSGTTSTVYRSKLVDGTAIAIKVTTPHLLVQPHNAHREARLLKNAAHIHIVPLISTEKIAGGHFLLVFPFLPYDMEGLLHNRALTRKQAVSHLHSLFEALQHIHAVGIIHRDIKPSNLLLKTPSGPAYLADFGIAWYSKDPDCEPADDKITDVGTTCYRPPELLFGNKSYDVSLDMWAAGCVVAEVLQGSSLFDAGELGSDLALIRSIFMTLGTPDDETWPEARGFRDWGKIQFANYPRKEWADVLPDVGDAGRGLVERLVCYQSSDRLSAGEVLRHPFFTKQ